MTWWMGCRPDGGCGQGSLCASIDRIVLLHHAFTWEWMGRALPLLRRVRQEPLDATVAEVVSLTEQLCRELAPHMLDEERVLFPRIRALAHHNFRGGRTVYLEALRVVVDEQDHVTNLFDRVRALKQAERGPTPLSEDALELYRQLDLLEGDLRVHVELENQMLSSALRALEDVAKDGCPP